MAKTKGSAGRSIREGGGTYTTRPISLADIDAQIESITVSTGPQSRSPRPGMDPGKLRSLYRDRGIVEAASRFRYSTGETGKELVDRYLSQGGVYTERRQGATWIVTLKVGNSSYPIRNREVSYYAALVFGRMK